MRVSNSIKFKGDAAERDLDVGGEPLFKHWRECYETVWDPTRVIHNLTYSFAN